MSFRKDDKRPVSAAFGPITNLIASTRAPLTEEKVSALQANALAMLKARPREELDRSDLKAHQWCRLRFDQERNHLNDFLSRARSRDTVAHRMVAALIKQVLEELAKARNLAPALPNELTPGHQFASVPDAPDWGDDAGPGASGASAADHGPSYEDMLL